VRLARQLPPLVMSRYYVVTDMNNEEAYHVTYIPAKCGEDELSASEAIELYEGNVITRFGSRGKDEQYCLVRAGFDRKVGARNYRKFGAYEMHWAKVRPVCEEKGSSIKGYVCGNGYIPKYLRLEEVREEFWGVDLTRAAELACFGEFEDDHGRWVGVRDFESVIDGAHQNEKEMKVDFLDVPRNNWHMHHRVHVSWMRNATHRSITEYMKAELPHPLLDRVMQRLLRVDRVIAGGKEYYQMWSESPDVWGYVVNFPMHVGEYRLSKRNALDLYEQRSTVIYHKSGDKNDWHYVVPFGMVEELKNTDYQKILAGGYVAKLSEVFPKMDESGKMVVGYVCNDIAIPKKISVGGRNIEVSEKHAAQLANFGEMWDWRHSPVLKVANYPAKLKEASVSQKPIEVTFVQCNNVKQQHRIRI
jgi:hypothetical protein